MTNLFDTSEYPEVEPTRLIVGDRWLWKRTDLTDYPVASYALTYHAVRHGTIADAAISITASESGTDYVVEVASTTTDNYLPGLYNWSAFITRSDSERIRLSAGTWELIQDLEDDHADPRTHAQIQVDLLQDKMTKLNARLHQSYTLGARSVTLVAIDETRRELNQWQHVRAAELNTERRARGKRSSNSIRARF